MINLNFFGDLQENIILSWRGSLENLLFNNIFPSQSDFITFFVSGKIEPGNFNLDISITNAGRDKIWDNSIDINSKKNSFVKRILLPKDVLSSGLRKMITVNISQNKFKDKKRINLLRIV